MDPYKLHKRRFFIGLFASLTLLGFRVFRYDGDHGLRFQRLQLTLRDLCLGTEPELAKMRHFAVVTVESGVAHAFEEHMLYLAYLGFMTINPVTRDVCLDEVIDAALDHLLDFSVEEQQLLRACALSFADEASDSAANSQATASLIVC